MTSGKEQYPMRSTATMTTNADYLHIFFSIISQLFDKAAFFNFMRSHDPEHQAPPLLPWSNDKVNHLFKHSAEFCIIVIQFREQRIVLAC